MPIVVASESQNRLKPTGPWVADWGRGPLNRQGTIKGFRDDPAACESRPRRASAPGIRPPPATGRGPTASPPPSPVPPGT